MKFSQGLEWLKPFIESVDTLVPNLSDLASVRRLGIRENTKARIFGVTIISTYFDGTKETDIYLYTEYNSVKNLTYGPVKFKKERYTKIEILNTVAHELTHLQIWDHTPERQLLESKIMARFMELLIDQGYVSQEAEEESWKYEKIKSKSE